MRERWELKKRHSQIYIWTKRRLKEAENPTYREAKVAIQKLDNDLRIETGAYISKKRVNDICTK